MKLDLSVLQNASRSQKILMGVLFFVMVVGGFVYWVFLPQKEVRDELQRQVADLNAQITLNQTKVRRLEALKKENEELQKMLSGLQAQLPAEQEVSDLLRQVSDIGVQSGLNFKLWKPGGRKTDPSGLYVEIPVEVEVAGGYHSVAIFLDRVSKLPRIVNASNLKMQGAKPVEEKVSKTDRVQVLESVDQGGTSSRTESVPSRDRVSIATSFVATTFAAVEK